MEHTQLRDEEENHKDGGSESDNATRKCAAVEIFIDFWISIQIS